MDMREHDRLLGAGPRPAEAMADEADAVRRAKPELVALDAGVAAARRRRGREREAEE